MTDYTLNNAQLTALPVNLYEDRQLQTINVAHNNITCIDSLPPALVKLVCDDNKITTFMPNDGIPSSLAHLSCSHNQITELPYDIPERIEYLDCSYNQITNISDIIYKCWSLKTLIIDHNNLTRLPYLPRPSKGGSLNKIILIGGRADDPLLKLYPQLQKLEDIGKAYDIVDYVNKINDELQEPVTESHTSSDDFERPWYIRSAGFDIQLGTPIGTFGLKMELPILIIFGLVVYKTYRSST